MTIPSHDFPGNPASLGYCVFPAELENHDHVFFHATHANNYDAIVQGGFKIPDPEGLVGLQSVSFAKRSITALNHAMHRRVSSPGAYCIFAVRYESLCQVGLTINVSDAYDYVLDPSPVIIGYCIVPDTYQHQ